ncbi:DEAD-box ATP-dependent RNA helicase 39, partial [Mucuna pruriens]
MLLKVPLCYLNLNPQSATSMAGATGRTLFTLSLSSSSSLTRLLARRVPLAKHLPLFPRLRPLCSVAAAPEASEAKHSMLLERLRARHLKDTARAAPEPRRKAKGNASVAEAEKESVKEKKVVASFEELGVSEEVMGAVREMGIEVPTEIQAIGVPAVLEEKSVVLGSHTGSGKTLAYLLPLVQDPYLFLMGIV